MKRQSFVSKGSLSRIFKEAAEAWKRQEYQQSIETLERAAKLDPDQCRHTFGPGTRLWNALRLCWGGPMPGEGGSRRVTEGGNP